MDATERADAAASAARIHRRRRESAKDVILTITGALGMIVVAWVLGAAVLHLSVIVFVTGSMSPTMPTGSAAVVQRTAAAELRIGDVVTVSRPDSGLPVTHRIVDIEPVGEATTSRTLTLKGDANDIVDSDPYVVDEADRVLAAAPAAGWVVIWARNPIVMIAMTLAVAVLIAWGLWPPRPAPAAASATPDQTSL